MSALETKDLYLSSLQTMLMKLEDTYHIYDEQHNVLVIPGLHANVGVYPISDFIIYYDKTGAPQRIIESAFRKDYKPLAWLRLALNIKSFTHALPYTFGFKTAYDFKFARADYTSCREDWLECLGILKNY